MIRPIRWIFEKIGPPRFPWPDANRAAEIDARVVALHETGESVPAVRFTLRFRNHSEYPLAVESYRIDWAGGSFTASPVKMRLSPRSEVERTARVEPRHCDISTLIGAEATVSFEVKVLRARAAPS